MYLLVNLQDHMDKMGEIITHLVGTYNVPISIVDNMMKLCPTCSAKEAKPKQSVNVSEQIKVLTTEEKKSPTVDPNSDSPIGRRTAAKNAAIIRALEKPALTHCSEIQGASHSAIEEDEDDCVEITPPSVTVKTEPQSCVPILPIGVPSPPDQVSSSGIKTPTQDTSAQNDYMKNEPGSMATLHPTLLACLLSSTPNMFAGNGLDTKNLDPRSSTTPDGDEEMSQSPSKLNNFAQIISEMQADIQRRPSDLNEREKCSRKSRMVYSQQDLRVLEQYYQNDPNACANGEKKRQMMALLGVDANRLKVWFQNRRRRDKIRNSTMSPRSN